MKEQMINWIDVLYESLRLFEYSFLCLITKSTKCSLTSPNKEKSHRKEFEAYLLLYSAKPSPCPRCLQ